MENQKKYQLGEHVETKSNFSQVFGNAWVSGNARICGNAQVYYSNAWVFGDARIYESRDTILE